MYHLSIKLYEELATALRQELAGKSYYSGSVRVIEGDVETSFTASLIIYRTKEQMPEGALSLITDVVPVWWECHTTIGSEEILNDCDFALLRPMLRDM